MKAQVVCICAVVIVSLLTVFGVVKADGFSVNWPIESPIFIRTIINGHTGVDMVSANGSSVPIMAAASGTVTSVYYDSYCVPKPDKPLPASCPTSLSGGWMVVIDHGDGWETRYAHLQVGSIVVDSDPSSQVITTVPAGAPIATIGNSGFYDDGDGDTSLPIHLHFELRYNGVIVNPCDYLVGIVGGCGVDGTIPTSVPTSISVVTATPIPTATAEPTSTPDPTANDHDLPTGGIVDAPVAVNHTLTIKVNARDASGIRQVQVMIWPTGGAESYIDLTNTGNDTWETSINVNQYPNGTVLNFMIRAWDASVNNNTAQLTGTHTVTVVKDTEPPTGHYISAPTMVDSSLTVRAGIMDPSGVAKATLYSTIGTYEMSREEGIDIWSVTVETDHIATNTTFTYNIHASDVWGNSGQITGSSGPVTVIRDTTPPTGYYITAPGVAGASLGISAHIEDPSGVAGATLHSGIGTYEMVQEGTSETWSVTVETGHLALGTTFNYNIHARDGGGNSGQVTGNQPVTVDDREPPKGGLVNVNPNPYNNLVIQAEFDPDLSGVAWVQAKYKIGNGGWQTKNMLNLYSNHWELNMDIRYVPHGTRIEYYVFAGDLAGNSAQTTGIQPVDVTCPGVALTTWCAEYYNNTTLTGTPAYSKGEGGLYIERNYGAYEPEGGRGGLGNDNFSIRWSKVVDFGTNFFNFSTVSDDGVRVFVNESVVINERHPGGDLRYTVNKFVPAGKYVVVLEYVEYGGLAHVKFTW